MITDNFSSLQSPIVLGKGIASFTLEPSSSLVFTETIRFPSTGLRGTHLCSQIETRSLFMFYSIYAHQKMFCLQLSLLHLT